MAIIPGGVMRRVGRLIELQSTLTAEEHQDVVEEIIASENTLVQHQEKRRARLVGILEEIDPVNLIARGTVAYLYVDPDMVRESEHDRSPAHVEYLALSAKEAKAICSLFSQSRSRRNPSFVVC